MQLHDARGKRLYLTAEECRTFMIAPALVTCSMRTLRSVACLRVILTLAFALGAL
jgi:hypothetical protein